jgi:dextranase
MLSACVLLLLVAGQALAQTRISEIRTDKARYNPGNTVNFTLTLNQAQSGLSLEVRNFHLNNIVSPQTVTVPSTGTTVTWSWTPPNTDYKGYLVSVRLKSGTTILDETSVGVDVSSDWGRFPRYGFLSKFGYKSDWDMDVMIRQLNRYHLNGIQFYDWMDKHHRPLAGTAASPSTTWYDLANRLTYFETVKGYIDRGHNHNMKAMFYNLAYGAYPNSSADGISSTWGLYRDQTHTTRYSYGGWPTNWEVPVLDIQDPSNTNWRNYIFAEHNKVYNATYLNFDGWHVDQLGDPGTTYNYNGTRVYLDQTYGPFLTAAKNARTDRELVMNAVNQYGQGGTNGIGQTPVKFLYTEVWSGNEDYYNLGNLVQQNESIKPGSRTVLAAYVNKGKSGSAGTFNDAAVLMADATIFAFGGSHIELGEHMLGNEYFPNSNLQMSAQLQKDIVKYYDFLVAYENVLRDGRTFNNVTLSGGTNVRYWPPVQGKVATVGASWNGKQVFHLLNYTQAQTMNWRDDNQVQPVPSTLSNLSLNFPYSTSINKIWVASPDFNHGLPQQVTFTQSNGTVTFSVPQLKYWSMVVVEPGTAAREVAADAEAEPVSFDLAANVPNPFGQKTTIRFTLPEAGAVKLYLSGPQGFSRRTLLDKTLPAGYHEVPLAGTGLKPGVYVCQLVTNHGVKSQKLVKIRE